jgi:hypothetical protein
MSVLKNLLKKAELKESKSILSVNYGLSDGVVTGEELIKQMDKLSRLLANPTANPQGMQALQSLRVFSALLGDKPRMSGVFSPSECCDEDNWCQRKFYFDLRKIPYDDNFTKPAETDNGLKRLFDLGTMVHWYIQACLYRAGILTAVEVPVVSKKYLVNGSMDGEVFYQGEKMALEIKTMNTFQFGRLTSPVEKQVKQVSIYAHFNGLEKILMVYYDKNTSEMKEFVVDVNIDFVERFKALSLRVQQRVAFNLRRKGEDITLHQLEPRVCKTATCARASKCPYTSTCFNLN